MKRFLFAVAVAVLSATAASAEEKPTAPPPATPAAPVVVPGTPIVEYAPAQPARRGLFARLRNRGTTTYSGGNGGTIPLATPPATITPATPMPMPGTTPTPMPPIKPTTGTTTDGTIIQIGGTTTPMTTTGTRSSFLSRLRNR